MSSEWKLVPVEPTETMVINGFESEPEECFSDEEVWEQYQGMSGCQQAAFRAKLCWAAMVAAAPAPDTHNAAPEDSAGVDFGIDGRSVRVSQEAYSIFLAREAAGREKIEALQQRLNAADQRIDDLAGGECEWSREDDSGIWNSGCGETWSFHEDGPEENGMHFCHSCGKHLVVEVVEQEQDDDWHMNPCKQGHRDVGAAGGVAACNQCDEKIEAATTQEAFERWNASHPAPQE